MIPFINLIFLITFVNKFDILSILPKKVQLENPQVWPFIYLGITNHHFTACYKKAHYKLIWIKNGWKLIM